MSGRTLLLFALFPTIVMSLPFISHMYDEIKFDTLGNDLIDGRPGAFAGKTNPRTGTWWVDPYAMYQSNRAPKLEYTTNPLPNTHAKYHERYGNGQTYCCNCVFNRLMNKTDCGRAYAFGINTDYTAPDVGTDAEREKRMQASGIDPPGSFNDGETKTFPETNDKWGNARIKWIYWEQQLPSSNVVNDPKYPNGCFIDHTDTALTNKIKWNEYRHPIDEHTNNVGSADYQCISLQKIRPLSIHKPTSQHTYMGDGMIRNLNYIYSGTHYFTNPGWEHHYHNDIAKGRWEAGDTSALDAATYGAFLRYTHMNQNEKHINSQQTYRLDEVSEGSLPMRLYVGVPNDDLPTFDLYPTSTTIRRLSGDHLGHITHTDVTTYVITTVTLVPGRRIDLTVPISNGDEKTVQVTVGKRLRTWSVEGCSGEYVDRKTSANQDLFAHDDWDGVQGLASQIITSAPTADITTCDYFAFAIHPFKEYVPTDDDPADWSTAVLNGMPLSPPREIDMFIDTLHAAGVGTHTDIQTESLSVTATTYYTRSSVVSHNDVDPYDCRQHCIEGNWEDGLQPHCERWRDDYQQGTIDGYFGNYYKKPNRGMDQLLVHGQVRCLSPYGRNLNTLKCNDEHLAPLHTDPTDWGDKNLYGQGTDLHHKSYFINGHLNTSAVPANNTLNRRIGWHQLVQGYGGARQGKKRAPFSSVTDEYDDNNPDEWKKGKLWWRAGDAKGYPHDAGGIEWNYHTQYARTDAYCYVPPAKESNSVGKDYNSLNRIRYKSHTESDLYGQRPDLWLSIDPYAGYIDTSTELRGWVHQESHTMVYPKWNYDIASGFINPSGTEMELTYIQNVPDTPSTSNDVLKQNPINLMFRDLTDDPSVRGGQNVADTYFVNDLELGRASVLSKLCQNNEHLVRNTHDGQCQECTVHGGWCDGEWVGFGTPIDATTIDTFFATLGEAFNGVEARCCNECGGITSDHPKTYTLHCDLCPSGTIGGAPTRESIGLPATQKAYPNNKPFVPADFYQIGDVYIDNPQIRKVHGVWRTDQENCNYCDKGYYPSHRGPGGLAYGKQNDRPYAAGSAYSTCLKCPPNHKCEATVNGKQVGWYPVALSDDRISGVAQTKMDDEAVPTQNTCNLQHRNFDASGPTCTTCLPGYQVDVTNADGPCIDINECSPDPCFAAGTQDCSNGLNEYTCNCKLGYVGDLCHACAAGYGGTGAQCEICPVGTYSVTGTAIDDPCDDMTCPLGHGVDPTLQGNTNNSCVDCSLTAQYSNTTSNEHCQDFSPCPTGYAKQNDSPSSDGTCEDINECDDSQKCGVNGTCVNADGAYRCECNEGYTGDDCGTCDAGYEADADGNCRNIDNCANNPCGIGGTCHDGIQDFTCTCKPGYFGSSCHLCTSGYGGTKSNTCEICLAGTFSAGNTPISTECSPMSCPLGQGTRPNELGNVANVCDNCTDGWYSDTTNNEPCKPSSTCGYGFERRYDMTTGVPYCFNIDDCASDPCVHGTCTDRVGGVECACEDGYRGHLCNIPIPDGVNIVPLSHADVPTMPTDGFDCPEGTLHRADKPPHTCHFCPANMQLAPTYYTFDFSGNPVPENDRCESCPPGTSSKRGQIRCVHCPKEGNYITTLGECEKCPANTYSEYSVNDPYAGSSCTPCPEHTFYDGRGAVAAGQCRPCPAGTENARYGGGGSYVLGQGCQACPAGKWSLPNTLKEDSADNNNFRKCWTITPVNTPCAPGTFNEYDDPTRVGPTCTPCPAGTYQDEASQTSCKQCKQGTYADGSSNTYCTRCPAGRNNRMDGASVDTTLTTLEGIAVDAAVLCTLTVGGQVDCQAPPASALPTTAESPGAAWRTIHACGSGKLCGVMNDGNIGCIGTGTGTEIHAPSQSAFYDMECSSNHVCGLTSIGAVECFGDNADGQSTAPSSSFVDVTVQDTTSCGLTDQSNVECWGTALSFPSDDIDPTAGITMIRQSNTHLCAVTAANTVQCRSQTSDVHDLLNQQGDSIVSIDVGADLICALTSAGQFRCAGTAAAIDALGLGATGGAYKTTDLTSPGTPDAVFERVAVGADTVCALDSAGVAVCYGAGAVQVTSGTPVAGGCVDKCLPGTMAVQTNYLFGTTFVPAGGCAPCPAGKYQSGYGQQTCEWCEKGTASNPGSAQCDKCPGGTFSAYDVSTVTAVTPTLIGYEAQPGYFDTASMQYVEVDPIAVYSPSVANAPSDTCTACASGKSSTAGSSECGCAYAGYVPNTLGKNYPLIPCVNGVSYLDNQCIDYGSSNWAWKSSLDPDSHVYKSYIESGGVSCEMCGFNRETKQSRGVLGGVYPETDVPSGIYLDPAVYDTAENNAKGLTTFPDFTEFVNLPYTSGPNGADNCVVCPGGYDNLDGGACDSCRLGFYRAAPTSFDDAGQSCIKCGVHTQPVNSSGAYAPSAATACQPCADGYENRLDDFSLIGGPCVPCSANAISTGGSACTSCGADTETNDDNVCTPCPPGTGNPLENPTATASMTNRPVGSCSACPLGRYSSVAGMGCTSCGAHHHPVDSTGAYAPSSAVACDVCPAGYENPLPGVVIVEDKYIVPDYVTAECTACPAGKYSLSPGTACVDHSTGCPKGMYLGAGSTLADACQPCPNGYYQDQDGFTGNTCRAHSTRCENNFHWVVAAGTAESDITCVDCGACVSQKTCPDVDVSGVVDIEIGAKEIPAHAFLNCGALQQVGIPDSVVTIHDKAFQHSGLTSVALPNSVVTIGNSAFENIGLATVSFPDSVATIGNSAFRQNVLTEVTVPNSVVTLGDSAFRENNVLTKATVGAATVGSYAFAGNAALDDLTLTASVQTVGDHAFYQTGVTSVTVLGATTTFGSNALDTIDQFCGTPVNNRVSVDESTQAPCYPCAAGEYTTATYALDDSFCAPYSTSCGPGTFMEGTGTQTEDRCKPCPPGQYQDADGYTGSTCRWCLASEWSPAGSAMCHPYSSYCGPGEYRKPWGSTRGTSDLCFLCPAGTFQSKTSHTDSSCTPCPSGTFSPTGGATCQAYTQTSCGAGEYGTFSDGAVSDNICLVCPAGTFQSKTSHTDSSCRPHSPCGIGQHVVASSVSTTADITCVDCPAGTYQDRASFSGTACLARPAGDSACGEGFFYDDTVTVTAENCHACPHGTYQTLSSHTEGSCVSLACDAGMQPFVPSDPMDVKIDIELGDNFAEMELTVATASGMLLLSRGADDDVCDLVAGNAGDTCQHVFADVAADAFPLRLTGADSYGDGWTGGGKLTVTVGSNVFVSAWTVDTNRKLLAIPYAGGAYLQTCETCPANTFQPLWGSNNACTAQSSCSSPICMSNWVLGSSCPAGEFRAQPSEYTDGCSATPSCPAGSAPAGRMKLAMSTIWSSACPDKSTYFDLARRGCAPCTDASGRLSYDDTLGIQDGSDVCADVGLFSPHGGYDANNALRAACALQGLLHNFVCHDQAKYPPWLMHATFVDTGCDLCDNDASIAVDTVVRQALVPEYIHDTDLNYFGPYLARNNVDPDHLVADVIELMRRTSADIGMQDGHQCATCPAGQSASADGFECVCPSGEHVAADSSVCEADTATVELECDPGEMFVADNPHEDRCVACPDGVCETRMRCGNVVDGSVVFETEATHIPYGAFDGCGSLTTLVLPASIVSVGGHAFRGTGLTSVVTHADDIAYGDNAFDGVIVSTFCGVAPDDLLLPSRACASLQCPVGQAASDPYDANATCAPCPDGRFQATDNFAGAACTPFTWKSHQFLRTEGDATSDNDWYDCPRHSIYGANDNCETSQQSIEDSWNTYITCDGEGGAQTGNGVSVTFDNSAGTYTACSTDTVTITWGGYHNIQEVTQSGYTSCDANDYVNSALVGFQGVGTVQEVNVNAAAGQTRYFICTSHCHNGAKFQINCPA